MTSTNIRTRSGWLYLAAVLDLHSRKIVGWTMAPDMPALVSAPSLFPCNTSIVEMLRQLIEFTQYASALHQGLLKKYGLVGNAVMERFFLNLKMDRVWQRDYANHHEAMPDVADYIVGFYNCIRLRSKLGNMPPNAFERESKTQPPIDVFEIT